jgi:hypothetical protein
LKALQIFAGPRALMRIRERGLSPSDVRVIPAAAGGPKGLTLLPLDRFLFGEWLPQSAQVIDLIGASIGAWRMAAAMLDEPVAAITELEHAYIRQDFDVPPGRKSPTRDHVSERFAEGIQAMFGGRVSQVLSHPHYRLHIVTSRGRHVLRRDHRVRSPLGYAGAFLTNVASRKAMGAWLERAVFSSHGALPSLSPLPFAVNDYRTRRYALAETNFFPVVQASCSIPFGSTLCMTFPVRRAVRTGMAALPTITCIWTIAARPFTAQMQASCCIRIFSALSCLAGSTNRSSGDTAPHTFLMTWLCLRRARNGLQACQIRNCRIERIFSGMDVTCHCALLPGKRR